jgi:hypothetical protein
VGGHKFESDFPEVSKTGASETDKKSSGQEEDTLRRVWEWTDEAFGKRPRGV